MTMKIMIGMYVLYCPLIIKEVICSGFLSGRVQNKNNQVRKFCDLGINAERTLTTFNAIVIINKVKGKKGNKLEPC